MRIWVAAEVEVAGRILFLVVCSTGSALFPPHRAILAAAAAVAIAVAPVAAAAVVRLGSSSSHVQVSQCRRPDILAN